MNPNDKTPLAIQPDSGIRLNLSNYYRIRTWQGGGEFWEHNNQQLIRDALGQFLPRATVDASNGVLFQHYEGGKEICSQSQPVTAANSLPRDQLDLLRTALIEFKAKTQDPKCDPDARKLIDCFRLPDPKKDPELYRIYGSGRNKRLIVLWGAEKEVDSAVPPLEAINMVHTEPEGAGKGSGRSMLIAALVVILALLGLFLWQRGKEDPENIVGNESVAGSSGGQEEVGANGGAGGTSPAGEITEGSTPGNPADVTDNDDAEPNAIKEFAHNEGEETASGSAPKGGAPSKPGDPAQDALLNEPGSQDLADTDKPAENDTEPKDDTGLVTKANNGDPTSENGSDGVPSGKKTTPMPEAGNSPESALNEPAADGRTNPLLANPPKEGEGEESANKISDADALAGDMPPESGKPPEKQSDAPKPGTTTETDLTETKLRIKETSPRDPNLVMPGKSGSPSTLPTGELEILKAEVDEEPRDGKVEVMLGLRGKAANDEDVQIDSATWFLDGAELKGEDGKPLNDPQVRRLLAVGKHTLSVVGRTKDGKEMRGEAKIDVRIKQQPISEVEIENKSKAIEK
jgi:hypothetical protein